MSRILTAAAAQLGPIQKSEPRSVPVERMIRLIERAHARGVELVVFPELALTTFFPRHYHEDRAEADHWFETAMPSNETAPLFEAARRYGIGFHLGYAELTPERPALQHRDPRLARGRDHAEIPQGPPARPRRTRPGRKCSTSKNATSRSATSAFPSWPPRWAGEQVNMGLMICNDRRWPEAWRVLGLQSVELVMLGYNTPSTNQDAKGFEAHHLRVFHSHLSVQAGAYQNACFAIATAKAGVEDGRELFGHSIIVNPQGEILAQATSWGDELITADLDLDRCTLGRTTIFNFEKHRRPEAYAPITQQIGAVDPPRWIGR